MASNRVGVEEPSPLCMRWGMASTCDTQRLSAWQQLER